MARFTNQAQLAYNNTIINSNLAEGELAATLTAAKAAVDPSYATDKTVTYMVTASNAGSIPFSGVTLTDDMGGYTYDVSTVYPLTYVSNSIRYYVNGVLQPAPAVAYSDAELTVSGITIPAGGNASIVYQGLVNSFASPASGSEITNTASFTGGGISEALTASAALAAESSPDLAVTKTISPATVQENGTVTYTFTIQNFGSAEADAGDETVLTDTFSPLLSDISVTFNGTAWAATTNYTYDTATGAFATVPGQITVPTATYTQNASGQWITTPGVSTLVISGTI